MTSHLCDQVGNHDKPRIASAAGQTHVALINMLLLTLPGTPNTYYGEELGMENINVTGSQDPAGKHDTVKTSSLELRVDLKGSCSYGPFAAEGQSGPSEGSHAVERWRKCRV